MIIKHVCSSIKKLSVLRINKISNYARQSKGHLLFRYASNVPRKIITVPPNITIQELATKIGVSSVKVIKLLDEFGYGADLNQNTTLEDGIAELVASEFDIDVEEHEINEVDFSRRPSIVTIMGHVDHGKTTLLDYLRKTSVAAGEAGGITQKVAAFSVKVPHVEEKITFIDTPGHAAFSAMRKRGVNLTDIVVLVVAADDGVMDQTVECIKYIREASVPFIIAINKMDMPKANPDKVKRDLARRGIVFEDVGGDVKYVNISALKGTNIDDLLVSINDIAKRNKFASLTDVPVEAVILETEKNKFKGIFASAVMKQGILKPGTCLMTSNTFGKVKQLYNSMGFKITSAGPSDPIQIVGWKSLPEPGDLAVEVDSEPEAKRLFASQNKLLKKQKILEKNEEILEKGSIEETAQKSLDIVIKCDVIGSVEAITNIISSYHSKDCKLNIVEAGVGTITDSDISKANTSNGIIYCFNISPTKAHINQADAQRIPLKQFNVIYSLLDDLKDEIVQRLPYKTKETPVGTAKVLKVFVLTGTRKNTVAGCRVMDGVLDNIDKSHQWRVERNGEVIFQGNLKSLKRGQEDVLKVSEKMECGIVLKGFKDLEEGDEITCLKCEKYKEEVHWNL